MTPARIRHYPRAHGPLPAGARWVGRPSRWGNPHKVGVELDAAEAVARFRSYAVERLAAEPAWLDPLRDASALACACRLGDPCHADVLAELLGAEEATP